MKTRDEEMGKTLFTIKVEPSYKQRMSCFVDRNLATRVHKSKRGNKKKDKQAFRRFLRDEYGL